VILWNFGFYINFIYEINKKYSKGWVSTSLIISNAKLKCSFQKEYEYFKYISISPGRTGLPLRTGSGPRGGVPRARAHLSERRRPRPNFEKCDGRRDAYEARNGNPSGTKFNVK
jgi:hypothetical protein